MNESMNAAASGRSSRTSRTTLGFSGGDPISAPTQDKGIGMFAVLKSQFLRRFLAGFSLGAIGMVAFNIEQVVAAPIF